MDGSFYPPKTLYKLSCGFMKSQNPAAPNFLDRSDHSFVELHHVCHTLFRQQLHRDGIGSATKETSIITKEEENKLWPSGILGLHHPKALLRTLILLYRQSLLFNRSGREQSSESFSI